MQAAESAASELQASTSCTRDANDIPRQLESVNLDFSGASLLTITLHTSSVWWHGIKLLLLQQQAQPGILTIISCCIQLCTCGQQAPCLVQQDQGAARLKHLIAIFVAQLAPF